MILAISKEEETVFISSRTRISEKDLKSHQSEVEIGHF